MRNLLTTLCLLFGLILPVQALSLQAFEANYEVYRDGSYVAKSQFSLKKQNADWTWSLHTEAVGIYRLLTSKKPFSETWMWDGRLLLEIAGNYPQQPPSQSSWFDHANGDIYYLKKGKTRTLKLPDKLYNYHSIHLLYPQMRQQGQDSLQVDFYKNGKVVKSTLKLERGVALKLPSGQTMETDRVTQRIGKSDKIFTYYYHGDTLAPQMIEQTRKQQVTRMWKVDKPR